MKNSKIFLTLFMIAGLFLLSSCNCSEQKCRNDFGMIKPDECPGLPSGCNPDGFNPMDANEAKAAVLAAENDNLGYIKGVNVNQCKLYLFSQKGPYQHRYLIIGKDVAANKFIIMAKGITPSNTEEYFDVTGDDDPQGPTCPPSTKCS